MSIEEKFKYVFTQGDFLGHRISFNVNKVLYLVDDTFLEVTYNPLKMNIDDIQLVEMDYVIKHFSDQIDLSNLED